MEYGEVMQLKLIDGLPYSEVTIVYRNQNINVENVLVDTGSASTIFSSDLMEKVGISPQPDDPLHTIRGVGGVEAVFSRSVDSVRLGSKEVHDIEIEIGGMDYGFKINGILGMDILLKIGAIIDLKGLEITFK